ncbi:DUF4845 domain-containing protein [Marinimicrobium sp. ABcell2]|uniref:DUF4845 domain-containing protein n=1 Tax=Marinimicrobium sp. ABcell2 TaxID=3069751 RepID=UPI0027B73F8D|nr:DUF4845 domain-containing protein [Marinimicrobium sp. ABcell2]MDQ2075386.1 DUF4845 domain-containing protein [Marinimicrobium sp. ABcell2]
MSTLKLQRGISMPLLVLIIAIGGFFLLCAFKVVPIYAENRYVVAALNSLAADPVRLHSMTPREIRQELLRFYDINNVRSPGPRNNIEVEKRSGNTIVNINYETREPLVWNIDLVLSFENQLDSARPEACCRPAD